MKIFDFNIHLPYIVDQNVNVIIEQDLKLSSKDLIIGLEKHKQVIKKADGINVLLFNPNLHLEDISEFQISATKLFSKISYTSLFDFRRHDIEEYMRRLIDSGAKAIMFNSYLQKITDSDFDSVLKVCKFAEKHNLIICIDGSYGTTKMFEYDNIELACFIAEQISKTPIVIVHSGGRRILEAMLLALSNSNVWLDTSFSLPYYIGSSVELDFAFAYKKVGCNRVLFGTDNPYCSFDEALKLHLEFFERHRFTESQISDIMYNNSISLFHL
ncbi:amidohydrolase family protein [Leptospira borgpetersenii]|uniref:amidohydrolase family protein n=2 Tax=Leptospira borgpetersenii TaxID=174 RepID=UPI000774BA29|nr:amidohydrolase family protein [Leptospira borgpetersenii]MBE8398960.1 amidohydrolase family protein [Leptospira borgpetersenii serovar Tarassovi]MBE8402065.1 amidohydrolase family protein [Leptospira borgpetersenii serovar Tarassovi]MBE8406329.1 amidohydrolase family protein [Leptospira borgpetersenii serovar Tarassovi]MBE8414913.1 amidohydrolase family protein [Leptospira borgpetersenii serovar Tarassovi]MBE8425774.1 amidohydrolase family protein [Leptospira borgpetersenii serovar Tarassov